MAAKVIAQLIIKGSTILAKAFVAAYQQALNSMRALNCFYFDNIFDTERNNNRMLL